MIVGDRPRKEEKYLRTLELFGSGAQRNGDVLVYGRSWSSGSLCVAQMYSANMSENVTTKLLDVWEDRWHAASVEGNSLNRRVPRIISDDRKMSRRVECRMTFFANVAS